jgi:hypothetical protein
LVNNKVSRRARPPARVQTKCVWDPMGPRVYCTTSVKFAVCVSEVDPELKLPVTVTV